MRETAVAGTTVMAAVLAAVYWVSRIGFDNPVLPVLEALGLSLFLLAAPYWIMRIAGRPPERAWWRSESVAAIGCIGLTVGAGVVAGRTGLSAAPLFAIAGFVLSLLTLARWAPGSRARSSFAFIAGAAVFTVWCAGVVWGSRYKMPLFWETLSLRANIHHDTFYYAGIANMLETYGVPSTGLDGIPVIRYHFGSPWLFAKWGDLLGTDVLSFYSLGYPVIVLPLFFSSLLLFSAELRRVWGSGEARNFRSDPRVWLVFAAATVGFIPTGALDALAVWNSNAFISESYLIGMPVFFLALGAGLAFGRSRNLATSSGTWDSFAFLCVFVPLILSALGFLKISLMILAFALALYLAARLGWYRKPIVLLSVALAAVAVAVTYMLVSLPAQNTGISLLHFMRFDAKAGWQQFFPLIHLLWTWVYLGARVWEEGARDFTSLRAAIRANRLIDAEAVGVIALLGFLPGELIAIHGGSAVYFSDVQRWLALSCIIARLAHWKWTRPQRGETHAGLRGVRLSTVLLVFVALPFVATLIVNLAQWPVRVLRTNLATRQELAAGQSTYLPIVTALREIARLPEEQRKKSLLFIPQSSAQYWSMFNADNRCTYTPLIAPAIASVAMVDGMPPPECKVTDQYNMTVYSPRERPQSTFDQADHSVCARARARGFDRVIVLEAPDGGMPRRRRVDCYLH